VIPKLTRSKSVVGTPQYIPPEIYLRWTARDLNDGARPGEMSQSQEALSIKNKAVALAAVELLDSLISHAAYTTSIAGSIELKGASGGAASVPSPSSLSTTTRRWQIRVASPLESSKFVLFPSADYFFSELQRQQKEYVDSTPNRDRRVPLCKAVDLVRGFLPKRMVKQSDAEEALSLLISVQERVEFKQLEAHLQAELDKASSTTGRSTGRSSSRSSIGGGGGGVKRPREASRTSGGGAESTSDSIVGVLMANPQTISSLSPQLQHHSRSGFSTHFDASSSSSSSSSRLHSRYALMM
jgi:hypothetical protein